MRATANVQVGRRGRLDAACVWVCACAGLCKDVTGSWSRWDPRWVEGGLEEEEGKGYWNKRWGAAGGTRGESVTITAGVSIATGVMGGVGFSI